MSAGPFLLPALALARQFQAQAAPSVTALRPQATGLAERFKALGVLWAVLSVARSEA
jgi:hypothetical protein